MLERHQTDDKMEGGREEERGCRMGGRGVGRGRIVNLFLVDSSVSSSPPSVCLCRCLSLCSLLSFTIPPSVICLFFISLFVCDRSVLNSSVYEITRRGSEDQSDNLILKSKPRTLCVIDAEQDETGFTRKTCCSFNAGADEI